MRRVFLLAALSLWAVACAEASAAPPEATMEIVVATRDLPAGTLLKSTDVATRSVPRALVTASLIPPGSLTYLVDQRLLLPMLAGDPLQWGFFESHHVEAYQACAPLENEHASAQQQVARARQILLKPAR